ncbi:MAG: hypothetical protein JW839_03885 [Candidatus Lokiarchaeota archaeon]|nr:hypothetical protein [Candidatus Lokiarchaeota archaeon]
MGKKQQPSGEPAPVEGAVTFTRKPAKTGDNYVIWIPRAMVRQGLVDPDAEYEVYLRKLSDH